MQSHTWTCADYVKIKNDDLTCNFNCLCLTIFRILDHVEEAQKAKQTDVEEGENIKKQVDMYMSAKQAIEEQQRKVG